MKAVAFNVQKTTLLEGFKIAQKVIGRSSKKADAKVELSESKGEIVMHAVFPGLCQLDWSIAGTGTVPFTRLVAPLDMLRGVVERMPSERISVTIDPENDTKLQIKCGTRSGIINMTTNSMTSITPHKNSKMTYQGDMKDLVTSIKLFDRVSLGGFNAWGCVCAAPNGLGYATDEGNLYAAPFPIALKHDKSVMLPTKILLPVTFMSGKVEAFVSENDFRLKGDNWVFTVALEYVQAPGYEKVINKFNKLDMLPINMTPITKEIKDFRKACKEGSLIVSMSGGKIKVKATKNASIAYTSESEGKDIPDVEFIILPENYLKIGPNFKKGTKVAKVNGSHLFLKNGDCNGIVSCHEDSIKFNQEITSE